MRNLENQPERIRPENPVQRFSSFWKKGVLYRRLDRPEFDRRKQKITTLKRLQSEYGEAQATKAHKLAMPFDRDSTNAFAEQVLEHLLFGDKNIRATTLNQSGDETALLYRLAQPYMEEKDGEYIPAKKLAARVSGFLKRTDRINSLAKRFVDRNPGKIKLRKKGKKKSKKDVLSYCSTLLDEAYFIKDKNQRQTFKKTYGKNGSLLLNAMDNERQKIKAVEDAEIEGFHKLNSAKMAYIAGKSVFKMLRMTRLQRHGLLKAAGYSDGQIHRFIESLEVSATPFSLIETSLIGASLAGGALPVLHSVDNIATPHNVVAAYGLNLGVLASSAFINIKAMEKLGTCANPITAFTFMLMDKFAPLNPQERNNVTFAITMAFPIIAEISLGGLNLAPVGGLSNTFFRNILSAIEYSAINLAGIKSIIGASKKK